MRITWISEKAFNLLFCELYLIFKHLFIVTTFTFFIIHDHHLVIWEFQIANRSTIYTVWCQWCVRVITLDLFDIFDTLFYELHPFFFCELMCFVEVTSIAKHGQLQVVICLLSELAFFSFSWQLLHFVTNLILVRFILIWNVSWLAVVRAK